jgi:hypothetical protein
MQLADDEASIGSLSVPLLDLEGKDWGRALGQRKSG